ncbi:hypothetical protein KY348_03310 [Candidatus Woesearchaeota archaeon]|nr:hypothetical protein [Candidatus Woesearchaeota archaeon]
MNVCCFQNKNSEYVIKAEVTYSFQDKERFQNKVLPYVFGCGMFYTNKNPEIKLTDDNARYRTSFILKTKSLAQLVSATTSMLRFSPDCKLEKVKIMKCPKITSKQLPDQYTKKFLLGVILKPSLFYEDSINKVIDYALKNKYDFVKDDDVSEYSTKESARISRIVKGPVYLQKITSLNNIQGEGDWNLVTPCIHGWQLLEQASKQKVTAAHCAGLSPQISWESFIMFSRLAGAAMVICPDTEFDKSFDLKNLIKEASIPIGGVPETRIIIGGGLTPARIKEVLKNIDKSYYKNLGFAIGSWILKRNDKK